MDVIKFELKTQWWRPKTKEDKEMFEYLKNFVKTTLAVDDEYGITLDQLFRKFKEEMEVVPYLSLGFKNFKELIYHMEDILECRRHIFYQKYVYLFLKTDSETEGGVQISEIVSPQKTGTKSGAIPNGTRANTSYEPFETILGLKESMLMRLGEVVRANYPPSTIPPRLKNSPFIPGGSSNNGTLNSSNKSNKSRRKILQAGINMVLDGLPDHLIRPTPPPTPLMPQNQNLTQNSQLTNSSELKIEPLAEIEPFDQNGPLAQNGPMVHNESMTLNGQGAQGPQFVNLGQNVHSDQNRPFNFGQYIQNGQVVQNSHWSQGPQYGPSLPFGQNGLLVHHYQNGQLVQRGQLLQNHVLHPNLPPGQHGPFRPWAPNGQFGPNSELGPHLIPGQNGLFEKFWQNGQVGQNSELEPHLLPGQNGYFEKYGPNGQVGQNSELGTHLLHGQNGQVLENSDLGSNLTHVLNEELGKFVPNGQIGETSELGPHLLSGQHGQFAPIEQNDQNSDLGNNLAPDLNGLSRPFVPNGLQNPDLRPNVTPDQNGLLGQFVPSRHFFQHRQFVPPAQFLSHAQFGPPAQFLPHAQVGPPAQFLPHAQFRPPAQFLSQAQFGPPAHFLSHGQFIPPPHFGQNFPLGNNGQNEAKMGPTPLMSLNLEGVKAEAVEETSKNIQSVKPLASVISTQAQLSPQHLLINSNNCTNGNFGEKIDKVKRISLYEELNENASQTASSTVSSTKSSKIFYYQGQTQNDTQAQEPEVVSRVARNVAPMTTTQKNNSEKLGFDSDEDVDYGAFSFEDSDDEVPPVKNIQNNKPVPINSYCTTLSNSKNYAEKEGYLSPCGAIKFDIQNLKGHNLSILPKVGIILEVVFVSMDHNCEGIFNFKLAHPTYDVDSKLEAIYEFLKYKGSLAELKDEKNLVLNGYYAIWSIVQKKWFRVQYKKKVLTLGGESKFEMLLIDHGLVEEVSLDQIVFIENFLTDQQKFLRLAYQGRFKEFEHLTYDEDSVTKFIAKSSKCNKIYRVLIYEKIEQKETSPILTISLISEV